MKTKKAPKSSQAALSDQVFSHPVKRINADDLKKVTGGLQYTGPKPGFKSTSSVDNQGRSFD